MSVYLYNFTSEGISNMSAGKLSDPRQMQQSMSAPMLHGLVQLKTNLQKVGKVRPVFFFFFFCLIEKEKPKD